MTAPAKKAAPVAVDTDETQTRGTRDRLLGAAAEVIQESGWGAASVGAIAERAGVAAGTLYRHFASKAELFVEVVRAVSERELAAMHAASVRERDVPERFDAVVATYARRALHNRPLAWALVYEPVDALVDAERLAYRRNYREGMASLLRKGMDAGTIPAQDAELVAAAVVGVIAETLVGPLSPVASDSHTEDDIVATIVTLCRRVVGLGRRPKTASWVGGGHEDVASGGTRDRGAAAGKAGAAKRGRAAGS